MNKTEKRMEELREKLNEAAEDVNSFSDKKVLIISKELDKFICAFMRADNAR